MHLLPRERDKLLLYQAGSLAQRRLALGVKLNVAEATALIAHVLGELIRTGRYNVSQLMSLGKTLIGHAHVQPHVPALLHEVMVEGTFVDGTFLVTVHEPICTPFAAEDEAEHLQLALFGSGLSAPNKELFAPDGALPKVLRGAELPGATVVASSAAPIHLCPARPRVKVRVTNTGDRPIQVGSHYNFLEVNPALSFPRLLALGKRLDIAAGTAVRFEPGDVRTVTLVQVGGEGVLSGGNAMASGRLSELLMDEVQLSAVKQRIAALKCKDEPLPAAAAADAEPIAPATLSREAYCALYGPTVGDRVRLADTDLWIEVEKDYTSYGDECKFGGGKVLRDGMGQASGRSDEETLDLVVINALIVDYWGIVKADIGVKNGMIVAIGKAGNPDIMDGVTPGMVVGSCTEVIAGEKLIVTAGAIDAHVHYICPDLIEEALASGITTLLGGGTGPSAGTSATTCTPGKDNLRFMLRATDHYAMNLAFTGKGNDSQLKGLQDQIRAGCCGLKIHEDWGTTPAVIDACLTVCDEFDVQCNIHTDTLNESSFVEGTIDAFKGRTIHTYHSEGAGGGHSPDVLRTIGQPNVLPSSTNPTRPYTKNTLDEHLDMLMVCHHLSKDIAEDVAFADSRIRAETISAEDVLQDQGAISIISSDSQAMGRIGEVVARTWRTAAKMRGIRGPLQEKDMPADAEGRDNQRVKRYVAKYTINPAIVHGMSHLIGSVEVGKLADLVLHRPENFGTKPEVVIKGGQIAWAQMGDANASIPTVQPIYGRPMYGAQPGAAPHNSIVFVSKISIENGNIASYGIEKRAEPVVKCRAISKRDMKLNNALPAITVDPETYDVHADGVLCQVPPAERLPMTQAAHFF